MKMERTSAERGLQASDQRTELFGGIIFEKLGCFPLNLDNHALPQEIQKFGLNK